MTLKFLYEDITDVNLHINELMDFAINNHRQQVIDYLDSTCSIDCETFEGGIDDWFGLGSVTLYELGLVPTLEFHTDHVLLTI